jgi:hypothetical protein
MDGVQRHVAVGRYPARSVVEDAATAHGGQLVPVANEREACAGFVGDREQGEGGVLVEHAGFVDEEEVAREKP